MPRREKAYRRLPGREAGLLRYGQLWLGPDHLLLARTTAFSEEYKRFYFRDIQAIVTRRTERREILNIIFAFIGIVSAVLSVFTDSGWRIFFVVTAGAFGVALLVNWLRGPTCVCHIRTAVQTEELSSLKRFRAAATLLERLRPNIEKAQGPVAPELLKPNPTVQGASALSEPAMQPAGDSKQASPESPP